MVVMQRERAKFWLARDFDDMEMLRATYFKHRYVPHFHEEYAIGIMERGEEGFAYRRRDDWTAPEGTICAINPGEVHTGHATSKAGWTYRMFYPKVSVIMRALAGVIPETDQLPVFSKPIFHDDALFHQMRHLHETLEFSDDPMEREAATLSTFATLILRHADFKARSNTEPDNPKAVQQAKAYIHANYMRNITLQELATVTHMSPYHLNRLFSQQIGLPPHAYLNQIRVDRARALLGEGMPIAEVAVHTGFSDQSHLTRRFKRVAGITPGRYAPA